MQWIFGGDGGGISKVFILASFIQAIINASKYLCIFHIFLTELSQTPTRKSNTRKQQRNKNILTVLNKKFESTVFMSNDCLNLCLIEHERTVHVLSNKVCFVNCIPPEVTKKTFIAYVCIGCEKLFK